VGDLDQVDQGHILDQAGQEHIRDQADPGHFQDQDILHTGVQDQDIFPGNLTKQETFPMKTGDHFLQDPAHSLEVQFLDMALNGELTSMEELETNLKILDLERKQLVWGLRLDFWEAQVWVCLELWQLTVCTTDIMNTNG